MMFFPAFQAVFSDRREVRRPTGSVTYLSFAADLKAIPRSFSRISADFFVSSRVDRVGNK
jgi:hypothetical protein